LRILNGAEKEVWIGAFMFKVGGRSNNAPAKILEALVLLHRAGVRVHVLLERPKDAGSDLAGFNSRTARLLKDKGIEVIMDRADRRSHMKVIVVDRRYTILGSHNLTQSALRYNHEYSVLVDSPCLAQKTVRYLQKIMRESDTQ
jgi:phosphatidylserine/phosphatidylglycerophosphate/cardiolipin synthase-like enzyme